MDDQLKARLIGAAVLVAIAVLFIPELLSGRKPDNAPGEATGRGTRTVVIDLNKPGTPTLEPSMPSASTALPPGQVLPSAVPPAATPAPQSVPASEPEPVAATEGATHETSAPQPASKPAGEVKGPSTSAAPAATVASTPAAGTPAATSKPPATPPKAPTPAATAPARTVEATPPKAKVKPGGWAVQVGAFSSAAAANKLVVELGAAGYPAYVSPIVRGGKTLHRVRVGPEPVRGDADKLAARLKGRNLPATVVAND